MSAQPAMLPGRIHITENPPPARLRVGGRRPPSDGGGKKRALPRGRKLRSRRTRSNFRLYGAGLALVAGAALAAPACALTAPDLAGMYRCEGNQAECAKL